MEKIIKLKEILNKKIGQRELLLKSKNEQQNLLRKYKREQINIECAQRIIQEVAKQTQKEIKLYISNLVSLALATVYDDPYMFDLDFIEKRGRTEAVPYFIRNEKVYLPGKETGGGPVDIASFALRLSLWCLNKSASTFILDEPFGDLDEEAIPRTIELLKKLSKKFNMQFIIITHNKELARLADREFIIKKQENVHN